MTTSSVLTEVFEERRRQDEKWGVQSHPDGTGSDYRAMARMYRQQCDRATADGTLTYLDILLEEVFEAAEESDKARLRAELLQAAAVSVAWIEKLDREAEQAKALEEAEAMIERQTDDLRRMAREAREELE